MKKLPSVLIIAVIALLSLAGSCSKEYSSGEAPKSDSFNLTILFKPVVDTLPLHLDSVTYSNYWKEKYSVSAFKFYVCGFRLINTDSNIERQINSDKYFLVNAADSTTWSVRLAAAPNYRYNRISFTIGVDSAHNVGGAQTGALDPVNGMFWTWNSGYVMAKLEGQSPVSPLVNNKMEYHIGGFRGDSNVLRQPILLFPYNQFLQVAPGRKSVMTITANTNAWFYNPHQVKISDNPSCTTPGQMAKDISENYSKMFTVTAITN